MPQPQIFHIVHQQWQWSTLHINAKKSEVLRFCDTPCLVTASLRIVFVFVVLYIGNGKFYKPRTRRTDRP